MLAACGDHQLPDDPVVIGSSALSSVISLHVMFGPMLKPRFPTTSITNAT